MADDATRWLNRDEVARYLSLRVEAVDRMARDGRLPLPSYSLGPRNPRWDRIAIDTLMEGGVSSADADAAFEAAIVEWEREARLKREAREQRKQAKEERAVRRLSPPKPPA